MRVSLLDLGFRPFFLFGAAWTVLQIAVWSAYQAGGLDWLPLSAPTIWHAHEMIFGYTIAIIAGFLLTASQNWTGIPGVKGGRLLGLVAIWGLARLFSFFWESNLLLFALVDLSFLPLFALALVPYLWQKRQRNNWVFFPVLGAYFLLNLFIHLNLLGVSSFPARSCLYGAVYLTIAVIGLIGGRVLPFFTRAVLPDAGACSLPWLEKACAGALIAFSIVGTFWEFSREEAFFALLAATLHGARWILWRPWRAWSVPVLFVLHAGYFWLPLGLFLKGLSTLGYLPPSAALHALTAGCIGTMIYGMITRVALGHSGRPIRPKPVVVGGYFLIWAAALVRVAGPLLLPALAVGSFVASGALWMLAHLIFLAVYAPFLLQPRADGR
jgi:uncharacterized protein involved in response to NO